MLCLLISLSCKVLSGGEQKPLVRAGGCIGSTCAARPKMDDPIEDARSIFFRTVRGVQAQRYGNTTFSVHAEPIAFCDEPDALHCRLRMGGVKFRRGWHLTASGPSSSLLFGGLSALIHRSSMEWLAVSDIGWLVQISGADGAEVTQDWRVSIQMLRGEDGRFIGAGPLDEHMQTFSDVESLAFDARKQHFLVGFESRARVWEYSVHDGAVPGQRLRGGDLSACPSNLGAEALLYAQRNAGIGVLDDRRLIFVICEGRTADSRISISSAVDTVPVYLFDNEPNATSRAQLKQTFAYPIVDGLMPSAAALHVVSDRVLILERLHVRGAGVVARLRRLRPTLTALVQGRIPNGELLRADLVAEFCPSDGTATDNFEGIAVDGSSFWLVSDDNFHRARQRTLLLEFSLPEDDEWTATSMMNGFTTSTPRCSTLDAQPPAAPLHTAAPAVRRWKLRVEIELLSSMCLLLVALLAKALVRRSGHRTLAMLL